MSPVLLLVVAAFSAGFYTGFVFSAALLLATSVLMRTTAGAPGPNPGANTP